MLDYSNDISWRMWTEFFWTYLQSLRTQLQRKSATFGKLIRWNKSGEFLNSINSLFRWCFHCCCFCGCLSSVLVLTGWLLGLFSRNPSAWRYCIFWCLSWDNFKLAKRCDKQRTIPSCIKFSFYKKWTKKSFNKVSKQQIFIKKNIRLKAPIPADKEEVNFLYGNNLPRDLKSKRSVVSFPAKPWFRLLS